MRTFTFIGAAAALLAGCATPAAASETDSIVVSVVVLPSCIVEAAIEPNGAAPQVRCNAVTLAAEQEADACERARAVAPRVDTLEGSAGVIVRVTY